MAKVKERVQFYIGRIKAGRLKSMWLQLKWISVYGRKYFWQMVFYTALGVLNTVVSLLLGFVSKDLVDIITGHQTGQIVKYFVLMIVYNIVSMSLNQFISYLSSYISMKVDAEIKSKVFSKILVTDWESLTNYHFLSSFSIGLLLLRHLRQLGIISHIGSDKTGTWVVSEKYKHPKK